MQAGRRPRLGALVAAVSLIAATTLIWHASYAALVATVSNRGNAWYTGTVELHSEDGGGGTLATALFTATDLAPGVALPARCITVVYSGSLVPAEPIHFYTRASTSSVPVNGHTLASYLTIIVEEGTGATDTTCTGFTATSVLFDTTHRAGLTNATIPAGSLMDLAANNAGYDSARVGSWTPAAAPPTTSRSYRFTVAFPGSATFPGGGGDGVDNDVAGMSAGTTFVWEVRS